MLDHSRSKSLENSDERNQYEQKIFDGAGQALQSVRGWARGNLLSPIAALNMCLVRILSSLPAGTTFNAGVGDSSLNLFIALVGSPGQGKDRLINTVSASLEITDSKGIPVLPVRAALGSGEGIEARLTAMTTEEGTTPAPPVIFEESEAGRLESLMTRQGSTLRPNLLKMYSGGPLGTSNKGESTYVPANSYTAGLVMGVQPDKAGVLLGGYDDGLSHRFVWTDLLDPKADEWEYQPLMRVMLPPDLALGIQYPKSVHTEIRAAQIAAIRDGALSNGQGHENFTRLKLAAGLALLRQTRTVSTEDWYRAGILVEFSEKVRTRCLEHLNKQEIAEAAAALQKKEDAEEQHEQNRVNRCRDLILEAFRDPNNLNAVPWSGREGLPRKVHSRDRKYMNTALNQLIIEGIVTPWPEECESIDSLIEGPKFPQNP